VIDIPIYKPKLGPLELAAVTESMNSEWISSRGPNVSHFEKSVATLTGFANAVATSNGTTALHVSYKATGMKDDSVVHFPAMTYVATLTPALHLGVKPRFLDVDPETWVISIDAVENLHWKNNFLVTVDLFGNPTNYEIFNHVTTSHGKVISDSAGSIGSTTKTVHSGKFATVSTLSFFGNKTITTGEGGMVLTDDPDIARRVRRLCNQGLSEGREYWYEEAGFNFRMTNIAAGIGIAQLGQLEEILESKQAIFDFYNKNLDKENFTRQKLSEGAVSNQWMCSFLAKNESHQLAVRDNLRKFGVESRPFFPPLPDLPFVGGNAQNFPVARDLWKRGFSLPSWPGLSVKELTRICEIVNGSHS